MSSAPRGRTAAAHRRCMQERTGAPPPPEGEGAGATGVPVASARPCATAVLLAPLLLTAWAIACGAQAASAPWALWQGADTPAQAATLPPGGAATCCVRADGGAGGGVRRQPGLSASAPTCVAGVLQGVCVLSFQCGSRFFPTDCCRSATTGPAATAATRGSTPSARAQERKRSRRTFARAWESPEAEARAMEEASACGPSAAAWASA